MTQVPICTFITHQPLAGFEPVTAGFVARSANHLAKTIVKRNVIIVCPILGLAVCALTTVCISGNRRIRYQFLGSNFLQNYVSIVKILFQEKLAQNIYRNWQYRERVHKSIFVYFFLAIRLGQRHTITAQMVLV